MTFSTWLRRMPWSIVAVTLALVAVGWIGIARSEQLAESSGRLIRQQVVWSVLALLAMFGATVPNYRIVSRWSYVIFSLSLLSLALVYFFPAINGSRRWIRIAGIGFQPSEFAKLATVMMLARYLMYRENFRRFSGLLIPLAITTLPVVLILREPDLGTAAVFLPILLLLLVIAGARRRDLLTVIVAGLILLPVLWTQMSLEQRSRVTALFQQNQTNVSASGDSYHLHQAKQMLVLGGIWGSRISGSASDDPTVYHVPEGATDSVFVVLGERFGLVGIACVFALYLLLVWRAISVAGQTREPFGRLLAAGVGILFGIQVLINTGMLVGLLPITGLSLPLISYGGSGLLAHALAIGMLMNIALRHDYEVSSEPFRFAKPSPRKWRASRAA